MSEGSQGKRCAKCRSFNPADISHCRYCHNSFAQLKTFVDKSKVKKPKVKRNILLAGAGVVAAAAGYIWKRKSPED